MRYGFIGTGGITTAIVTGLCTADGAPPSIWVSPRNRENAEGLAREFTAVQVAATNQEVLDHADLVVLAILPQDRQAILKPLRFREHQTVIHLLAGTTLDQIAPLVAPASDVVRAVPLPCTAIHKGPIAIYPRHDLATRFFGPLGTIITLEDEGHLETLSIVTALMAPYYAMAAKVVAWAEGEGIRRQKAAIYAASMFEALSAIAGRSEDGDIGRLVNGCMTPGGLNELAMETIGKRGGFDHLTAALETVKQKILTNS